MAVVLSNYREGSFNSLPPFEVAGPSFDKVDGAHIIANSMMPLFRKHSVERILGLQLLHHHFKLQPEERLVDFNGTSVPIALDIDQLSNFTPSVWGIKCDNTEIELSPLEFALNSGDSTLDNSSPWSKSNFQELITSKKEFFIEYTQLVRDLGIDNIFGFARYPGDGYPGRVEITVGRAHVNLTPTQVDNVLLSHRNKQTDHMCKGKIYAVGKSREAAWFFTDDFIQHGCRCLCPEKNGVHHGHGSHHITQSG